MAETDAVELHASVYKALANAKRLQIVECLMDGEKSVSEILECKQFFDTPQTTVSQHLALLRQVGLLTARKEGTNVFYKLANTKLIRILDLTRQVVRERLEGLHRIAAGG